MRCKKKRSRERLRRERKERRAQEAREEEKRAQEAREEEKQSAEGARRAEGARAQEERKRSDVLRKSELRKRESDVETQGRHESELKAQKEHEDELKAQGEQQENANSVHEECHVSHRHMTWWHNAWWIRVDNGPHMRSARGRRRVWRAARRAAEQARDEDGAGEVQRLAEEAEWEKWGRRQTDGQTDRLDRAVRTLCTSYCTCRKT